VASQPELLAHHYTEAGLSHQAIVYWYKAGQRAIQRSSNIEAAGHLTKGLAVLSTLPDTLERTQHELRLQLALGAVFIATKGYAASEVENVYIRAQTLCQALGEMARLPSIISNRASPSTMPSRTIPAIICRIPGSRAGRMLPWPYGGLAIQSKLSREAARH
jgi:predicted ATPase